MNFISVGQVWKDEENFLWEVIKSDGKFMLEGLEFPGIRDIDDTKHMKYIQMKYRDISRPIYSNKTRNSNERIENKIIKQ